MKRTRDSQVWPINLEYLGEADAEYEMNIPEGEWAMILDSAEERWHGPGSLLPASVMQGEQAPVRGFSFGLYVCVA